MENQLAVETRILKLLLQKRWEWDEKEKEKESESENEKKGFVYVVNHDFLSSELN